MFDFRKRVKTQKTKKKEKGDYTLLLFIVLGALLGFATSYFTSSMIFFPIILFGGLFIYGLMKNQFVPKKIKDETKKENLQYLSFYQHLISYGYMENSFHEGFHKAIESLEISTLKDNLVEYDESDKQKDIPLSHLKTRTETRLIDLTQKELKEEEDDIKSVLLEMQSLVEEYEDQLLPEEREYPPSLGYVSMMILFLLALGYSLFASTPQ